MVKINESQKVYYGFEQGPIRPPSEAGSLLIRITRNCPWNRCAFCPVYKGSDFSLRPVDHVLEDIDRVYGYVKELRQRRSGDGKIYKEDIEQLTAGGQEVDRAALNSALQWASNGMHSIFLQDANSLVIQPDILITILEHLQQCFPWVDRVTSYARSHTIARIKDDKLARMREAGLSRIHIGMESGSDKVLEKVKKGVDKKTHIVAGLKIKEAGMELSEYIMPGLGGRDLSRDHALESADALNAINPDYIRLRTLAVPGHIELAKDIENGDFVKMGDAETAEELLVFLQNLDGITSTLKSDHILNLFEDLEGIFPEDKDKMIGEVENFLALSPVDKMHYQVGRRMGLFRGLRDLRDSASLSQVKKVCARSKVTPETVDSVIDELVKRFI